KDYVSELRGRLGDELLKVHVSYGPLVQKLLAKFNNASGNATNTRSGLKPIKALAHITGGGFVDNIPRILPKKSDVIIRKGSWEILPIFQLLQANGRVAESELYQVFNMGIGMILIVAANAAEKILRFIHGQNQKSWIVGSVGKGIGQARVE